MTITTTVSEVKLNKILGKILKLTERAEHPDTPAEEAESCRARAQKYIIDYDVQEQWLADAKPLERQVPVMKTVPVYPAGGDLGDVTYTMTDLFGVLARHCGVRVETSYRHEEIELEEGKTEKYRTFRVVGFDSDIRYLEILFASLRLHIATNLAPVWSTRESIAENVTRLHEAGVGYPAIADMAVKAGYVEYDRGQMLWGARKRYGINDKSVTAKLMRVYDRYCKDKGRDKILVQAPRNYRMWFLHGYTNMIRVRVNTMAELKRQHLKDLDVEHGKESGSSAIALRDRGEVVDEAFFNFFPELRPSPEPAPAAAFKARRGGPGSRGGRGRSGPRYNSGAVSAGSTVAKTADLSGGRNNLNGGRKAIG